jgi:hypothetical protein
MQRTVVARALSALLAACALAILAGCSGHTTGASDIKRQPDGTYLAKLNVVGSCEKGSPSTPCTAYTQWRKVGTDAWTKGPTVNVPKKVSDKQASQTATGLANNTAYEYQLCGKEFTDKNVNCVGPSQDESTDQFVIGHGSVGGGGGSSAAVPILIAVAAGILILGGVWWASRRYSW